jgi:hypothetical protein
VKTYRCTRHVEITPVEPSKLTSFLKGAPSPRRFGIALAAAARRRRPFSNAP